MSQTVEKNSFELNRNDYFDRLIKFNGKNKKFKNIKLFVYYKKYR